MSGSNQGAERRVSPRVDEVQLVQVTTPGSVSRTTGRTINLSRGGMRLEMGDQLPLRSRVQLSLSVGNGQKLVAGSVVYLEALDGGRCSIGVQFTDLDQHSRRRLDDYIARHGPI